MQGISGTSNVSAAMPGNMPQTSGQSEAQSATDLGKLLTTTLIMSTLMGDDEEKNDPESNFFAGMLLAAGMNQQNQGNTYDASGTVGATGSSVGSQLDIAG